MSAELLRMRDSQFSTARFLGKDESLLDLIKNDDSVLKMVLHGENWQMPLLVLYAFVSISHCL